MNARPGQIPKRLRKGLRVRSFNTTFTRQRIEKNHPLLSELCALNAINKKATRSVTSAKRFSTPTTARPGWRCWGSCARALTGWVHSRCLASDPYHFLAQTPEGCRASPCTTRSTGQGRRRRSRRQRSLVFHPRLQSPARRLPGRPADGRKIVLVNGRIVLTHLA